ncbi:OLC1v1024050C1 [Oldenlandia corymbosa var. corymbosa]|uniref:OLC1v1024050C1 n=1 Tax=Oldenlandia corymbosa var. corymbosa TaxID=529605 RepID=A0AAV1C1M1_OLDCO|nr:OLC1v1024050C1 [Oldenlandia corymbosa var. corymbosa]
MVEGARKMLDDWEKDRGDRDEFQLDVFKEFHMLTADILSRTLFGSSFEEGKRIFELQEQQSILFLQTRRSVYNVPGFRFLPTKNRMIWRLDKETRESMRKLIENKKYIQDNPKALLPLLLSPYRNQKNELERLSPDEIVDECRGLYFAGKGTTAALLTWIFILLAFHQDWQTKVREEVLRTCGGDNELPSADKLPDLKIVM